LPGAGFSLARYPLLLPTEVALASPQAQAWNSHPSDQLRRYSDARLHLSFFVTSALAKQLAIIVSNSAKPKTGTSV